MPTVVAQSPRETTRREGGLPIGRQVGTGGVDHCLEVLGPGAYGDAASDTENEAAAFTHAIRLSVLSPAITSAVICGAVHFR